jgi:hypothetical protein
VINDTSVGFRFYRVESTDRFGRVVLSMQDCAALLPDPTAWKEYRNGMNVRPDSISTTNLYIWRS